MNTSIPFPLLQTPGLRDPLACIRSFVAKCRTLARKRADHGAVLEYNVVEKFADREAALRNAGAKSVDLIVEMIAAVQADFEAALADGKLTAAERCRHEAQLADLYRQLAALSAGLAVREEAPLAAAVT